MSSRTKLSLIIGFLICFAVALPAGAYWVGQINQKFAVSEPIQVVDESTPILNSVYPGSVFTVTFQVKNVTTTTSYGVDYNGYISFWGCISTQPIYGVVIPSATPVMVRTNYSLAEQTVSKNGIITLNKPQGQDDKRSVQSNGCFNNPSYATGTVRIEIDSGAGFQRYNPGDKVLLPASGVHRVRATVRPSAEISPGTWEVGLNVNRGEVN